MSRSRVTSAWLSPFLGALLYVTMGINRVKRRAQRLRRQRLPMAIADETLADAVAKDPLTPLEFDLLVAVARKPRQVCTRDVLLEQVWGYRHPADTRLVNVHVQRLRAKVEEDPALPTRIVTIRGLGYKYDTPRA